MNLLSSLKSIKNLIIDSPMVEIKYKYNQKVRKVYAKCEWYSLTGSIKDRSAYQIYYDAIQEGQLKPGEKVVEVSSGNMGISLAGIGNLLGLDVTIIMPKNMSKERKALIKLYGARLVETRDFKSAFKECERYKKMGYFCPSQFENISNSKAHYTFTGKEIYKKLDRRPVKAFVAGVGTSGTLCGAGRYLKNKGYKIIAIEPQNAPVLSGYPPFSKHKLQGLSDEIKPKLYKDRLVDCIYQISDDDAIAMTQKLSKALSLAVGISSGANFLGAILSGQNCATVFPDDNKKYLSISQRK